MRCIIVEDDLMSRQLLEDTLQQRFTNIEVVATATTIAEGVRAVNNHPAELVFLDIELPDGKGFMLLEKLDHIEFEVIFITSHDDYAIKAFQYSAVDYILKPLDPGQLQTAVQRAMKRHRERFSREKLEALITNWNQDNRGQAKIALPTTEGYHFVRITDVTACEADGNYTHIFLAGNKKMMVSRPLKDLEALLPSDLFFRTHKSHLINLNRIEKYVKVEGNYIVMEGGRLVPLAARKRESFVDRLNRL